MTTYDLKQVITDYAHERITPEMAIGHALQHLEQMVHAQTALLTQQQALEQKVAELTQLGQQLQASLHSQSEQFEQQQTVMTALNLTIYQIKNEVDSLTTRLVR